LERFADSVAAVDVALWRSLAIAAAMIVALSTAGCDERPETGFLSAVAASAPGAVDHAFLVATTRERDPRPGTLYNGERASSLDYATVTVSVPPDHVPGKVEWPSNPPGDPRVNFVVRESAYLDGDKAFVQALSARLAAQPKGSRKVLVFIHGYNTLFAEGLYRFAQIVQDSKATAVPVLFTWASRGKLRDYIYDTNSATAARDDLEHTLRLVLASDADQVNILAHSMGNWVTVETLRQIKISGDLKHADKVGYVLLAAPDIDIDVFKSQMRRFGKPKKPFYVILSKDDKALWASSLIAGGETRVGDDPDYAELEALGAVVIDLTAVQGADPFNHGKFAQLAEVAPELQSVLAQGIATNPGPADATRPTGGGSLGDALATPLSILGAPVKIFADQ
jgi:esterase/lipase superfamily enzyme